jgi:uracil-DNA glycosylase family 4
MNHPFDPYPAALARCRRCPRLVVHRRQIARLKRRAYAKQVYWGKPVPGFGDPQGRILLLGLAPGAHGSNRTGRMFTGDASGDFLYPALWRQGFANQPHASARDDGLQLRDLFITAALRCVPPQNKPLAAELAQCRHWLARDLALPRLKVVLALGRIAHQAYLDLLLCQGESIRKADFPFAHGAEHVIPGRPLLVDSYHVSFQNTNTGRLTAEMFTAVLRRVRRLAGLPCRGRTLRSSNRDRSSA